MNKRTLLRRMRKSKFFLIGSIMVIIIVLLTVLSPLLVRHEAEVANLKDRLIAPQWFSNDGTNGYVLGTDALGRDVLTRILIGGRASLFIAVTVVFVSTVVGSFLGLLAGYYGKWVETVIMRIVDIWMAIPGLILAVCVVAVLGVSFYNLLFVLVLTGWPEFTRLIRGSVLSIKNSEYIRASTVCGASRMRIMLTQILPNVVTPLIILASQKFGSVILVEAAMSFLGVGVPMPTPAWGTMISEGRDYLTSAPWVVIAPGVALCLTVLAFNFLGDGCRDVFDPKNTD